MELKHEFVVMTDHDQTQKTVKIFREIIFTYQENLHDSS